MKKILRILLVLVLVFMTSSFWFTPLVNWIQNIHPAANLLKSGEVPKTSLTQPEDQTFALANVEIGQNKASVKKKLGHLQRETANEFGLTWSSYHNDYQNFVAVMYDRKGIVQGLYTNQALLSSKKGVDFSSRRKDVQKELGKGLNKIPYQDFYLEIDSKDQYDIYLIDGNYITFFYDIHDSNKVTAVQIINQKLEESKESPYVLSNSSLQSAFEYQLFDLTNAERVKRGYSLLDFNKNIRQTARKHSADMAKNNYFDHNDLAGNSPFDRLQADGIVYQSAGENIAQGQTSSIYAHQGLMNSAGHRKNILYAAYDELGVGLAFDKEHVPYYTENFIGK
ncbi:MAG TPA: CAP-associated domain-containing protein [Tetragenococcus sp.]|nr:CAP-associated domain-containing protein [Tetragenococcus sp.]